MKKKKSTPSRRKFVRVPEAAQMFALSRSRIYELIKDKSIKSINFRKRGATRGCRLIDPKNLSQYLQKFEE